ncbi:MAG: hypothetical protein KDB03_08145 [Planctomycetales bacterium]|nr:hypothetical protein [Planctomycetales bacterium]
MTLDGRVSSITRGLVASGSQIMIAQGYLGGLNNESEIDSEESKSRNKTCCCFG